MAAKPKTAPSSTRSAKAARPRMSLAEAMSALEQAGSEQTRKTYLRHGASEPLFGVSFATLKTLQKKIGVDHELALALWDTGNADARNLAMKIADPAVMSVADLDRWARANVMRGCGNYVAALASEGPHGLALASAWLASAGSAEAGTGWLLVGALAMTDEQVPDAWLLERLADIEQTIHSAPNAQREAMNHALIAIGCRSLSLRALATSAAGRIGKVSVDHGDTACKTADAAAYIEKTWAHSTSKGFDSPAAHERSRESMRLRC